MKGELAVGWSALGVCAEVRAGSGRDEGFDQRAAVQLLSARRVSTLNWRIISKTWALRGNVPPYNDAAAGQLPLIIKSVSKPSEVE